jgi:phospholipid transport system transporter-binding protein
MTAVQSGIYSLQGELTFASIDKQAVQALTLKRHSADNTIIVDLDEVTLLDSAGLALLIEWLKLAQRKKVHLRFKNIPGQLLAIARLSGFEQELLANSAQA